VHAKEQSSVCTASDNRRCVLRARAERTVGGDNIVFVLITVAVVFGIWGMVVLVDSYRRRDHRRTATAVGMMAGVMLVIAVLWVYMSALDAAVRVFL
jgi:hypothetical protein